MKARVRPSDLERHLREIYRGGRLRPPDRGSLDLQGLVEAMGGSIAAQSPALRRRGTRMILRFPAAEDRGAAQERRRVSSSTTNRKSCAIYDRR